MLPMLMAAAMGQAAFDNPDPRPVETRLTALEQDMAAVKARLGLVPDPRPVAVVYVQTPRPVAVRQVSSPQAGEHSHRCTRCGTVWSHREGDPNASHNCPNCGKVETLVSGFGPARPVAVRTLESPCGPNGCPAQQVFPQRRGLGLFR